MFGCLARIGCLLVIVAAGAIGWFTQDAWLPKVKAQVKTTAPGLVRRVRDIGVKLGVPSTSGSAKGGAGGLASGKDNAKGTASGNASGGEKSTASESQWTALSAAGADRGREAVAKLNQKNGPAYVNVGAADLASFVLDSALHGFSPRASGAQAIAKDDRLYMKAMVTAADLGGPKTLGPLSGLLEGKQELTVGGRLEVLAPGRAQFRVEEISLGELALPSAVIPRILARIGVKDRTANTPGDAVPVIVPTSLADVRVNKGHVTLYKSTP
jgi:hypothetical protein